LGHHHVEEHPEEMALSSRELEKQKVSGAIRTDLILSAEIMAISLGTVTEQPLLVQAGALVVVGLALTVGVYGVVGLIVKMDDIGLHMAQRKPASVRAVGRGLVKAMPLVLEGLTVVGTAAMLWVGGGIIVHGLETLHAPGVAAVVHGLEHWAGSVPGVGGVTSWLAFAVASAVLGLVVGGVIVLALKLVPKPRRA
jgi:predicted DNA repair protein MutK